MIRDFALLAARLAVGGSIAAHGAQKALGWFDGPGPEKAAGFMQSLGFRPGATYATAASFTEIGSGLAIALGLGGPLGPAGLISTMIVAGTTVHAKNGYFMQQNGVELCTIYGSAALALGASDYGAISFDAALGMRDRLKNPIFTALVLAGGVASALVILNSRVFTPDTPATPTVSGKNSPAAETDTPAA